MLGDTPPFGWALTSLTGDAPSDESTKAVLDNVMERGIPAIECTLTRSTIWTNQKVEFRPLTLNDLLHNPNPTITKQGDESECGKNNRIFKKS